MGKRKQKISKDKGRYKLPPPPREVQDLIAIDKLPVAIPEACKVGIERLNDALARGCALRSHFVVGSVNLIVH